MKVIFYNASNQLQIKKSPFTFSTQNVVGTYIFCVCLRGVVTVKRAEGQRIIISLAVTITRFQLPTPKS